MLKIPELPIYNTERYARYSPISPDDIDAGQIYTNDLLFIYISHLSFNKTAGYRVWDKDGEYVGTDVYSSHNIYAIATYLNKNDFRPLDYDMEVVNPFDTDKRYLLTPDGIKKLDDGLTEGAPRRMMENKNKKNIFMSKKTIRLTEDKLHKIIKESVARTLNEGIWGSATDNLEQARELLQDIMNSGFIPFASPSPSSTENEVKKAIIEAARLIDKASYLCGKLGYGSVNRTLGDDPNAVVV